MSCRIKDDKNLVILPLDKGSPPPWYPASAGVKGIYVPREQFTKLKKFRNVEPCGYCPSEVKDTCEVWENSVCKHEWLQCSTSPLGTIEYGKCLQCNQNITSWSQLE